MRVRIFEVSVGCVLVIVGLAIRLLCNMSFYFVLLGQVCCSAGNVYVLNTPTKVAANWWFPKNVPTHPTIASEWP